MYFNNDIKINKFINRSDFNNYLNCMFRTDSSQNLTNDLTPKDTFNKTGYRVTTRFL